MTNTELQNEIIYLQTIKRLCLFQEVATDKEAIVMLSKEIDGYRSDIERMREKMKSLSETNYNLKEAQDIVKLLKKLLSKLDDLEDFE